jgi:hypothetical protein
MLDAAIETVAATIERPVVHSDRGAHYRWPGWRRRIADARAGPFDVVQRVLTRTTQRVKAVDFHLELSKADPRNNPNLLLLVAGSIRSD